MIADLLTRPCTIYQVDDGLADEYGNPELEPDSGTTTVCELQQERGFEADETVVSVTRWRLFLPPDAVLAGRDYVVIDGDTYTMVSDPWVVRNPRTGVNHHVECVVRRAS